MRRIEIVFAVAKLNIIGFVEEKHLGELLVAKKSQAQFKLCTYPKNEENNPTYHNLDTVQIADIKELPN